mgnify:CR=1 FL=1
MYDQDFINDCLLPPDRPSKPLTEFIIKDPKGKIVYKGRHNYRCRKIAAQIKGTSNRAMKYIWPQVLKDSGYSIEKEKIQ